MITIYGSDQCPKTVKILELCGENNIEVDYKSFSVLKNIWNYVVLRDSLPNYDYLKDNRRLGVPCIICENGVTFDGGEEPFDADKVMKKIAANDKIK